MSKDNDLADLRTLNRDLKPEYALKGIIGEGLEQVQYARSWEDTGVGGGGSATAHFSADVCDGFEMKYSVGDPGNLLHELTHIAVFKSYKKDFINYKSDANNVNKNDYKWDKTGNFAVNMSDRMLGWRDPAWEKRLLDNLFALDGAVTNSGLPDGHKKQLSEKIRFKAMPEVNWEYDTVINQMLTWLHLWGYPLTAAKGSPQAPETAFWAQVNRLAADAQARRRAAARG